MYLLLDSNKILLATKAIQQRIQERFPESGLFKVSSELVSIGESCGSLAEKIRKPAYFLRSSAALLVAIFFFVLLYLFRRMTFSAQLNFNDFIQVLEAALNALLILGAGVIFLISIEKRSKRTNALKAIHSLRSLAHVIDMHQLSKDPERYIITKGKPTLSSPKTHLTLFELTRYLVYCTELLAIISKFSALYPQYLDDQVVLDTVDDVESLTSSLSAKISQKLEVINSMQSQS